jgi:hypothetical protein
VKGQKMKRFTLHLFVALLTFTIGVSFSELTGRYHKYHNGPDKQSDVNVSAWKVLLSFENQDLRKLDEQAETRLHQAMEILVGKATPNEFPCYFRPLLIAKMSNAKGQTRYALVEGAPLVMIPGTAYVRIYFFTTGGKFLSSSEFTMGNRIDIIGARVIYMPEIGRPALVVSSQHVINGADMAQQYYALIGEDLQLIRLEDSTGKVTRNGYWATGPKNIGRSVEERIRAIESNDVAEVLATLTWLSDESWNPRYKYEETNESHVADEVRSRESVKLQRLMQSDNAWLQSTAQLAANVDYDR